MLGYDTTSKPYSIVLEKVFVYFRRDEFFRKCADVFDQNPGPVLNEGIIEAGETAMMCLCDAIDHADGLSRLHKL